MLETLKRMVVGLTGQAPHFDSNDYRVAAAALLLHVATLGEAVSPAKKRTLRLVIENRFALDDASARALLATAEHEAHESVDLSDFTDVLNRSLDPAGRAMVLDMLWDVAAPNGAPSEVEGDLVLRAADMLGVAAEANEALRLRLSGAAEVA